MFEVLAAVATQAPRVLDNWPIAACLTGLYATWKTVAWGAGKWLAKQKRIHYKGPEIDIGGGAIESNGSSHPPCDFVKNLKTDHEFFKPE